MLLPCLIWFVVFAYVPMGGLLLAFKEFKFNAGILHSPWVGLRYFENFFAYPGAWQLVLNTIIVGLIKIVLYFPFPIILALMLNAVRRRGLKSVVQTISYLPHFLSWVVVAAFTFRILSPNDGIANQLLAWLGGSGETFFMMEEKYFYLVMFLTFVWKGIGWGSIIYLAAITNVDPTLYEAAQIDGANKWQQTVHVTLSGIRTTIGILLILDLSGLLSTGYEQNFLLRTAGNSNAADILDVYVLRTGMMQGQYGYATAVGMMQGVIGLLMVLLINKAVAKLTDREASLW